MIVADLIAELQSMNPALPVRIECSKTWHDEEFGEPDSVEFSEAANVRFGGTHVLIEGA